MLDIDHFLVKFDEALDGNLKNLHYGRFKFLLGPQAAWKKACKEVHSIVDNYIARCASQTAPQLLEQDVKSDRQIVFLEELVSLTQDRMFIRT